MSTKTIYKRIALVAVATLGAGLLSVAPANAAAIELTSTAVATTTPVSTTSATPSAAGTAITATVNLVQAAVSAAAHTIGATYTLTDPNGTIVTSSATFSSAGAAVGGVTPSNTANVYSFALAVGSTAATKAVGAVTFTPTTAGVYRLTYTTANTTLANGDTNTVVTDGVAALFHVSGSGAVVAASGIGTTTIGAVTGGIAKVRLGTDAHTSGTVYNLTTSGVGSIQTIEAGTLDVATRVGIAAASDFSQGARLTTDADTTFNDAIAVVNSAVAGTQTLTFTRINASTGAPTVVATQVITWGAAPVLSVARSTAFLGAGSQATVTADVSGGVQAANTAQTAAANAAASIEVITRNDAGTSLLATQTITASVSGPGTLSIGTDNTTNSTGRALTGAAGNDLILVFGDGTSGTSTITISQGTTVIATKTVTFYGAVATLTAKQNHRIASSAGAALGVGTAAPTSADIANTPAVVITAKDSNGNAVPGLTISAVSSDTTVMSSGITFAGVTATPGNYNVAVNSAANTSGKTATLTFRVMSGTTVLAATAPLTYTLGGSVASVALSLDAASYDAGAPAVATITVKDSSGNPAWDNDYANILTAALASSLSVTKALFGTTVSSLGGVSTVSFNAPGTSAAAWTISGTTGTGPSAAAEKGKALSATASVSNASADAATDAANEATDAANAATDAALAAADAADAATAAAQDAADAVAALSTRVSTLVSDLRKQISALTKLVKRLL